ncbi:hypothetical protein [Streptomyces sp. Ncost-T10-10d]|uniref:hypothetical protein n=1 Tax=Streptomyces sp. Ncost-T10-10d TaxID=1839774 RepID=UPI00081F49D7|nr:hypothetical protein GA0115254_117427 [Streptomyces sp. Ncost-T10-10d]
MKIIARALVAGCIAAALAWSMSGPGESAHATASVAEESPGYAVEDFRYPGADKILAEQGITLKRGDGHIMLADCSSGTGQLEVWSRKYQKVFCFKVTGDSGYLALEIPAVFSVRGNNYSTQIDMTAGDEKKSFDINKNEWTPVGESLDPGQRDFMLMEIRTSK